MTESELFEKIGRQHVTGESQDQAYTRILTLLAEVVGGTIDRSRVLVNLTARSWLIAPEGFRPDLPATINGFPVCVVAPGPAQQPPVEGAT